MTDRGQDDPKPGSGTPQKETPETQENEEADAEESTKPAETQENKKVDAEESTKSAMKGLRLQWSLILILAIAISVGPALYLVLNQYENLRVAVSNYGTELVISVLMVSAFLAIVDVGSRLRGDRKENDSSDWTARTLVEFWYIVWVLFTMYWVTVGPGSKDGFQMAEYLLVVVVPAFFPISAIAYTTFQTPGKKGAIEHQVWLLEESILGLTKHSRPDNPQTLYPEETLERYDREHSPSSFSAQTILPVMLSVIGVYVLINSSLEPTASPFHLDPAVVHALGYGFLGAYIFSVQLIYRRYTTLDLKPSIYMQCTATLLAGLAFNYVAFGGLAALADGENETTGLGAAVITIVAFSLGYFPGFAIRWFNRVAHRFVGTSNRSEEGALSQIVGLSDFHEVRLGDEGVDDIQNLATANVLELIVNTPFTTLQIIDWIDQAILRLYLPQTNVEAFRRASIRGISHFRDIWDSLPNADDNAENTNKTKVEELARSLQSSPDQLGMLYRATTSAPNLAFLDYPKIVNQFLTAEEKARAKRLTAAMVSTKEGERMKALIDSARNCEDFDEGMLEAIGNLDCYTEMPPQFIEMFGDPPSDCNERDHAISFARWYRILAEQAANGQEADDKSSASQQARKYYEMVRHVSVLGESFYQEAEDFLAQASEVSQ